MSSCYIVVFSFYLLASVITAFPSGELPDPNGHTTTVASNLAQKDANHNETAEHNNASVTSIKPVFSKDRIRYMVMQMIVPVIPSDLGTFRYRPTDKENVRFNGRIQEKRPCDSASTEECEYQRDKSHEKAGSWSKSRSASHSHEAHLPSSPVPTPIATSTHSQDGLNPFDIIVSSTQTPKVEVVQDVINLAANEEHHDKQKPDKELDNDLRKLFGLPWN